MPSSSFAVLAALGAVSPEGFGAVPPDGLGGTVATAAVGGTAVLDSGRCSFETERHERS